MGRLTTNATLCTALVLGSLVWATSAAAEIAIIANPASGASELDAKTAKRLFLGKTRSLPGMASITLVDQRDNSPTKTEFTQKVIKKSTNKYKAYWSKMLFSGKALPPSELADDAEVKAYVARHTDAIGYVDARAVDDSVKVLLRTP